MVRVLRNLKINEVSSVDKGAGEGVKVMFWKRDEAEAYWKRDFTQDQRDRAAQSGAAMPDGSFPIQSGGDLENAVRAIGRASDPAAAKKHIISRARALGMTDKLPSDWNVSKAMESEMTDDEIKALVTKGVTDGVAAAVAPLNDTIETLKRENVLLKMSDAHKSYMDGCPADQQKSFGDMTPAQRDDFMSKNPLKKRDEPVLNSDLAKRDETLAKVLDENASLKKRLDQADLEKAQADFKKRAAGLGMTSDGDGEILRKAYAGDKDAQAALEKRQGEVLRATQAQVNTGKLFGEFGTVKGGDADPMAQLQAKADELFGKMTKSDKGKAPTKEQAFDKVFNDPANTELREAAKAAQRTSVAA